LGFLVEEDSVNLRFVPFSIALVVAVSAAGQTPLTPAPASLSFTWVTGGTLPASQSISVKAGTSTAAFTTVIAPLGTQWMTITPSAGVLPASMSVLVNPSELPVGVYNAAIQLSATGFTSPLSIPITLTVEPAPPTLILSANALSFTTPPNPPATQTLTLTTSGGPVPFSIPALSAAWLSVTPTSGVALPGSPVTLTVSVTNTGLTPAAAAYSGKITIVATGVPTANVTQTVAVSMVVNALTPTITNLYPSAALMGSAAVTVTITGTGFYKGGTTASAGATPLQATYVNPTTISAVLPATILATAGTINVTVVNPAPGGISMPAVFTVSATPVVQAIVSAASYAAGAVSPGEFITMFGTGIGPAVPAEMSVVAGYATNTLQSTSVTIDGQNAPMIYVSPNQITVQVPYNVTIGLAKAVAVNNNGVIALDTVDTTAAAPGLFLISGVVGQCAALRYSMSSGTYSVNGTPSAALVGDIMVFYLTGEGIYDLTASPATGYIVPASLNPLPQLSPLPTVTIGGAPATVQYAGPVIGGLLGLLQINAVVPAGSTKGPSVPVVITIGAGATQAGATIVVK
jgi:uncharacterized protein (TIGR03437 family)